MKKFIKLYVAAIIVFISGACSDNQSTADLSQTDFTASHHPIINGKKDIYYGEPSDAAVGIILTGHPQFADQLICSGVLISPKHILTAAHCVADLNSTYHLLDENSADPDCNWTAGYISAGASDLIRNMKISFNTQAVKKVVNVFDIKRVTYHSGYSQIAKASACTETSYVGYSTIQNDIAILELTQSVPENVAKPIPILPPWLGLTQGQIDKGLNATFIGFGYNEEGIKGIRSFIKLPLEMICRGKDNSICPYSKTIHVKGCHPYKATCKKNGEQDYYDDKVAAPEKSLFYLQNKGGPCDGDSGSPAFVTIGNRAYVAGISSYGDSACAAYGISAAVQEYYDWIVKNAPESDTLFTEICDNLLDDDNNGLVDQFDPACEGKPYCGNGILDAMEECENDSFMNGDRQCAAWSYKYTSGEVHCSNNCKITYDDCIEYEKPQTCGNDIIDGDEQCDGENLLTIYHEPMEGSSCKEFSAFFSAGNIFCDSNCRINVEDCILADQFTESYCGNDVLDNGELCDGDKFGDMTNYCADWAPNFIGGKVSCTEDCEPDFNECVEQDICGDGQLSDNESCDGSLFMLNEKTCSGWSNRFSSGSVHCTSNCTIDYSECQLEAHSYVSLRPGGQELRRQSSGNRRLRWSTL